MTVLQEGEAIKKRNKRNKDGRSKLTGSTPGQLPGTLACRDSAHESEKWDPSGLQQHCRLLMVSVLISWRQIRLSLNLKKVFIVS